MKKSILVLTDLTDNAAHAAETATILATQIGCDITLLYCDNTISAISYYPGIPLADESITWYEHVKNKLKILSDLLKQIAKEKFPTHSQPVINSVIREGELLSGIQKMLAESRVELIAMGAKSGSSTDHFLFGSDTKTVVDHSTLPILIVPPAVQLSAFIHLTFASNLMEQDINALSYLSNLRRKLSANLEILHIKSYGKPARSPYSPVKKYIEEICAKKPTLINFKQVYGKKVSSRIINYCGESRTDLLVLSHQHHSYLFGIHRDGIVDQLLSKQHLPLLIIPKMKTERKSNAKQYSDLSNIVY